jgi:tRNA A-37 threonylcarbamoyl transferase component Bud32
MRSCQRLSFIERSEIPEKLHVRLGQRRWLIEVRLIAEHCYSGVNAPALL